MARKPGRMKNLGRKTMDKTNAELTDNELGLLLATGIDWERYRPQINDDETYDKLISAVQASTTSNEQIAQLKSRLSSLGQNSVAVAVKLVSLLPK